jgi:hypothetical protein
LLKARPLLSRSLPAKCFKEERTYETKERSI